jgi:LPS-assembly protein
MKLRDLSALIFIWLCFVLHANVGASNLSDSGMTLFADKLSYDENTKIYHATDNVVLVTSQYTISAKQIKYEMYPDQVSATGDVLIRDNLGNIITASDIVFKDKLKEGVINNFSIIFSNKISTLTAQRAARVDDNISELENPCYTACTDKTFANPIWQIKAKKTVIDTKKETISYRDVRFEVFGVPIIGLPYFGHPAPKAHAKSGLLSPDYDSNSLRLPLYLRIQPNMDFTITPRITSDNMLFEGEGRYINQYGSYKMTGSLSQGELIKRDAANNIIKDQTLVQYHFFGQGRFHFDKVNGGFNIKRTTDPAYLRKYYGIYDPYMTSNIYVQNVQDADYIKLEALYFQDMRSDKMLTQDPFVIPFIKLKQVSYFESVDAYGSFDSNNLFYKSGSEYQAIRSSSIFNISKTYELQNNFISLSLYDKIDLYKLRYHIEDNNLKHHKKSGFVKNISEMHVDWRYPLITNNGIVIEPVVLGSTTLNRYKDTQMVNIDSEEEFELNDLNLMHYNRYSGRDKNEFGRRISYGLNLQHFGDDIASKAFLGKSYSEKNRKRSDIVGNLSFATSDFDIYYRFNYSNKIIANMNEIGARYTKDKVDFFAVLFEKKGNKKDTIDEGQLAGQKVSNLTSKIKYNFDEKWSVDFGGVFNLVGHPSTMLRSIGVTYEYDCVKIYLNISDNFTWDKTRNIKKSKSNISFKIGFKTLNM